VISRARRSQKKAFAENESWTPVCLPRFDDRGFLHAYVAYLDGVDVDVKMRPKRSDAERDVVPSSRTRAEMHAGQRINPNDANPSEGDEKKDSGEGTSTRRRASASSSSRATTRRATGAATSRESTFDLSPHIH